MSPQDGEPKSAPQSATQSDADSSMSTTRKRSRADTEGEETMLSPEALAKMSRSERKRHREKKRRNDVNKGFDDLMELLLEIDPVVKAEAEERTHRGQPTGKTSGTGAEENILSRVELIGRTVEVLRKTHQENEQRKLLIQQLLLQGAAVPKAPVAPIQHPQSVQSLRAGSLEQLWSLRQNQAPTILPTAVLLNPHQQFASGNTTSSLPGIDLLSFARAQQSAYPGLAAAPSGSTQFLQSQLNASLLRQLAAATRSSNEAKKDDADQKLPGAPR